MPNQNDKVITYIYGLNGIIGFKYDNLIYHYQKNLLNDVVAIYQGDSLVAKYVYDAWGNHQVILANGFEDDNPDSIGHLNPIRYRSYYYDEENELYYCLSRYYYPKIRRWLNMDMISYLDISDINGINLFSYCKNNPTMYVDEDGFVLTEASFFIGLGIAAAIGAIVGGVTYTVAEVISYFSTREWSWSWGQFAGNVIGGAVGGILSYVIPGSSEIVSAFIAGITGFTSTYLGMLFQNQWEGTDFSIDEMIMKSILSGAISFGVSMLSDLIRIPGINSGRNSFSAISKQMFTKFKNGTISRITPVTFSKMLASKMTSVWIGSYVSAFVKILNADYIFIEMLKGTVTW